MFYAQEIKCERLGKVQWILCFLRARDKVRTISESPVDYVFLTRKKSSENDYGMSSGFCVSYGKKIKCERLGKVQWIMCFLRARNKVRTIRESPVDLVFLTRKK